MNIRNLFFSIPVLIGLCLISAGCENYSYVDRNINFVLSNSSNLEAHLYISGETIGPENKTAPNASRSLSQVIRIPPSGYEKTIFVGRNGIKVSEKDFLISQKATVVTATWDGTNLNVNSD